MDNQKSTQEMNQENRNYEISIFQGLGIVFQQIVWNQSLHINFPYFFVNETVKPQATKEVDIIGMMKEENYQNALTLDSFFQELKKFEGKIQLLGALEGKLSNQEVQWHYQNTETVDVQRKIQNHHLIFCEIKKPFITETQSSLKKALRQSILAITQYQINKEHLKNLYKKNVQFIQPASLIREETKDINTIINIKLNEKNAKIDNTHLIICNGEFNQSLAELPTKIEIAVKSLSPHFNEILAQAFQEVTEKSLIIYILYWPYKKKISIERIHQKQMQNEIEQAIIKRIKESENKMDGKIQGLEDRMDEKIKGLEDRMDEKIKGLEDRMDKKIKGLEDRMDEKIKGLEDRMDKKIKGLEDRMDEKIKGLEDRMDKKIKGLEDRMDEKIKGLEDRMKDQMEAMQKNIIGILEDFMKNQKKY